MSTDSIHPVNQNSPLSEILEDISGYRLYIHQNMTKIHDGLYEVLSNPHQRHLLFALLEKNPQTELPGDLDTPPDTGTVDGTARVDYHHIHLPKLADKGFIEWTSGTDRVERGAQFDDIRPALELLAAHHEDLSTGERHVSGGIDSQNIW
ncbi:hypothetical protein [Natrononativus amylolyticus]|uniref:hypothetical protein n=1 Tax=Natrononativus amylolyticus TaxID=2963434 RepID=UPI0020CD6E0C|nr:hypothetical protein [Natrononativus amylolyticus]